MGEHSVHNTVPTGLRIFGREPAAWVGLIEGVLVLLLAFGLGISQETFGPIMAVVVAGAGVYTAWATKDTMLAAVTALAKSLLTLLAVYGLDLSDEQTAAILGVVTLVVAFIQRDRTRPTIDRFVTRPSAWYDERGKLPVADRDAFARTPDQHTIGRGRRAVE